MAVDERGAFHGAGADSEAQKYECTDCTVLYQSVKHKQGPGGGRLESRDEKVRYRNPQGWSGEEWQTASGKGSEAK